MYTNEWIRVCVNYFLVFQFHFFIYFQIVGPFIDDPNAIFGDYSPTLMVILVFIRIIIIIYILAWLHSDSASWFKKYKHWYRESELWTWLQWWTCLCVRLLDIITDYRALHVPFELPYNDVFVLCNTHISFLVSFIVETMMALKSVQHVMVLTLWLSLLV